MMMKVRETAERDLTRLARVSASTLSLIGLLAAWVPSIIGRAAHRAVLVEVSVRGQREGKTFGPMDFNLY